MRRLGVLGIRGWGLWGFRVWRLLASFRAVVSGLAWDSSNMSGREEVAGMWAGFKFFYDIRHISGVP